MRAVQTEPPTGTVSLIAATGGTFLPYDHLNAIASAGALKRITCFEEDHILRRRPHLLVLPPVTALACSRVRLTKAGVLQQACCASIARCPPRGQSASVSRDFPRRFVNIELRKDRLQVPFPVRFGRPGRVSVPGRDPSFGGSRFWWLQVPGRHAPLLSWPQ